MITALDFINTCLSNGLYVDETIHYLPNNDKRNKSITIDACLPFLNKTFNLRHNIFCSWDGLNGSNDSPIVGYFDALWKENNTQYAFNGIDLGDCQAILTSTEQLDKLCKSVMATIKLLDLDSSFRPNCIKISENGPVVFKE